MPKLGLIGVLGDELKKDMWGTFQKVADLGYHALEGVDHHLRGDTAGNVQRLHDMGLRVLTIGANREGLRDKLDEIIANAKAHQASFVTVWWIPMETRESILGDAELFNKVGLRLAGEGLKLCYHNHEQEFKKVFNGVYALDILAEHTDPAALYFNVDIAWATYGGEDPARVIRRYASRVPVIHVKDLSRLDERNHFTALGTGVVKIRESLLAARETGVEWAVVEQDRLRHLSAMETIAASAYFLKESELVE